MPARRFLEAVERPLSAAETRTLRMRAASWRARGQRGQTAGLWTGLVVIAILWALTLLASDAPVGTITAFWLVVGGVIVWMVRRSLAADSGNLAAIADNLEAALRRNLAEVYEIRASGYVAFEEIEDEGACYAFRLAGRDEIVFLTGQEFYPEARFPSLDFALVFPLDEAGRRVDMLIDKRGEKAAPVRTVPASVKRLLDLPDDLEVVAGTLDELEDRLRSAGARA